MLGYVTVNSPYVLFPFCYASKLRKEESSSQTWSYSIQRVKYLVSERCWDVRGELKGMLEIPSFTLAYISI